MLFKGHWVGWVIICKGGGEIHTTSLQSQQKLFSGIKQPGRSLFPGARCAVSVVNADKYEIIVFKMISHSSGLNQGNVLYQTGKIDTYTFHTSASSS